MDRTQQSNARQHEPIMHRTAPEAAPMVAGRATGWGSKRSTGTGISMLAVGVVAALGALAALGGRIIPAFSTARETGGDAAAYYFFGTEGSTLELVLVVGLMVLLVASIVVGWLGYRRITDDGPSLAAVHQSNSPNAVINSVGGDGS